jgi:hypothetical protein
MTLAAVETLSRPHENSQKGLARSFLETMWLLAVLPQQQPAESCPQPVPAALLGSRNLAHQRSAAVKSSLRHHQVSDLTLGEPSFLLD